MAGKCQLYVDWKSILTLLVMLFAFSCGISPLYAQTTGTVFGTITDPSGASIAGAQVTAHNEQTGLTRSITASSEGQYTIPLLPVGQYAITVTAAGFQGYRQTALVLQVEQQLRVDVKMNVGSVTQQVIVTAAIPQVNTSNPTLGAVVEGQQIVDLPLNGRNFLELGIIQPGVVPPVSKIDVLGSGTNDTPGGTAVEFSVNGMRYTSNNFLLDGTNNVEPYTGAAMVVPSPDALEEFRILTNMYPAQYGRAGGSIVTIVTKSGTNSFHGTAYDFLRNDALDAKNFFSPGVPKLTQNQFGGAFGGPIVKDNTFFFASYEGFRQVQGYPSETDVPSLAERSGDFSADSVKPLNPFTGMPFPGGIIPSAFINPIGQGLLNSYPAPNLGTNEWTGAPSAPDDRDQFMVRLDHTFLQGKNTLTFRYLFDGGSQVAPLGFEGVGTAIIQTPGFPSQDTNRFQNLLLSDTHVLSPSKLNEFRFSYQRARIGAGLPEDVQNRSSLGFTFPISGSDLPALPEVDIPGISGLGYGDQDFRIDNMLEFLDNFTLNRGNHNLQFGVDIQHTNIADSFPSIAYGGYLFLGSVTGNPIADTLLGIPTLFLQAGGDPNKTLTRTAYYLYGQDSYRLSRRLTFNFGLRYELSPGYTAQNNQLIAFVPGEQSIVDPQLPKGLVQPGDPGIPDTLYNTNKHMFAPRIGLAWDPFGDGKTGVRVGYGVFYDQDSLLQQDLVEQPPEIQPIIVLILPTILPTAYGPPGTLADPYGGHSPFTPPVTIPLAVPPNTTVATIAHNYVPAYVQQYNLTVDRQLTQTWSLQVAYVGNKATHLQGSVNPNQPIWTPGATTGNAQSRRPYPLIGDIYQMESGFNSNYNGLQVTATKRFSRGLSVQANYTWSKALDYTSSPSTFFTVPGQPEIPQDSYDLAAEYGPSAFDIRNRLVISYLYQFPFFQHGSRLASAVLGGWRMSGITSVQSGMPFTVLDSSEPDLSGSATVNDRVNVIGNPNAGTCLNGDSVGTPNCWINPVAFAHFVPPAFGDERRNSLRADGLVNFDFGLAKDFRVHERQHFEFRWEIFNLFNAPNFNAPVNDFNAENFGQVQSTSTPARLMQVALKFVF
jgi:hypothetical protein